MIITCDIGNTSIKLGLYQGTEQVSFTIIESKETTSFKSLILTMIYKMNMREDQIDDAIISSVVPSLTPLLYMAIEEIIHKKPIVIDALNCPGIKIDTDVKEEVGSDLLVISSYAYAKYKKELIIVSLGTASVLCHVTNDGRFRHCIIAPGYKSFAGSLYNNAAKLPKVGLERKGSFLASNTVDAMAVGVIEGFIGMIRYLLAGLLASIGGKAEIIACGACGKEVVPFIKELENYTPDLVSDGLAYIYEGYFK